MLPKDILKYAIRVNGNEAEQYISNAIGEKKKARASSATGSINVMNGDTVTFGEALTLNATQNAVITNVEQRRNHLSNATETVVTYLTYG